jgi:hypothetical protein
MKQSKIARTMALLLTASFLFSALVPFMAGASSEGGAKARTIDDEPANNNINTPTTISSGDVVFGSLLSTSASDTRDWYRINVPYNKVINMSLYMENYSSAEPWLYNLQLVGMFASGGTLYFIGPFYLNGINPGGWLDLETENRWEAGYWINLAVPAGLDVWILVGVNGTFEQPAVIRSLPTNYTLNVNLSDPIPYSPGQTVTGPIDKVNGTNVGYYYKMDPGAIPEGKVFDVTLQSPVNGADDIYVRGFLTAFPNELWLQNASWSQTNGDLKRCRVGGAEGTYYIEVRGWTGLGVFSLTSDTAASVPDGNNTAAGAILVRDNNPHPDFIEQGTDPFDWWKVNMKSGKTLDDAYFSLTAPIVPNNLYCMYVYDGSMNLKYQVYNTENGSLPVSSNPPNSITNSIDIKSINATSDGPMYFFIRAIGHYGTGPYVPASGAYKMTFRLPNDPPVFAAGGIPEIHMLEDGVYDTLLISNYFTDPDGDKMAYSLLSATTYKTNPEIDNETGLLTLRPVANWSGTEVIRFKATDDGPGSKWKEGNVTVVVEPVNDPPFVTNELADLDTSEDMTVTTADLTSVFSDIDNQPSELKFTLKLISSETHPPGSALPTQYETSGRDFKLGPAHLFFGHFLYQVTCTDNDPKTVPVSAFFNLTISHKNHKPTLRENIQDPMELTIKEHEKDDHLELASLFTDPDLIEGYTTDGLNYTVTGAQKLLVSVNDDGFLVIDTGKEQYLPGVKYEEKLLITCKDRAGLKATLNLTVLVEPVNDPQRIVTWSPQESDTDVNEGTRKMFSVTAVDDDTQNLTYTWYLNGKKDKNAKGLSFAFEPDMSMGGEDIYTIRVDISDGTTTKSKEWNVTVNDINRLPVGAIRMPLNMTKFKKGTPVTFTADGSDDDGDGLTFIWRDAAGAELGRGTTITTDKLLKGVQDVKLEISDGKGSTFQTVTVVIWQESKPAERGFIPGFEGVLVVLALGIVIALAQLRRMRRKAN